MCCGGLLFGLAGVSMTGFWSVQGNGEGVGGRQQVCKVLRGGLCCNFCIIVGGVILFIQGGGHNVDGITA